MFSFHKPKIYRSVNGCCICRAKSSSSRFTDSCKYEAEFERCFKIKERRAGEICNACVLLVKRWKKLPPGTTRHWNHVVDARAGPGTKGGHVGRINNPQSCRSNSSLKTSQNIRINKKKSMKPKRIREIALLHDSLAGVYGEERMKRSSRRNSDGYSNYFDDDGFDSDSSMDSVDDRNGGRLESRVPSRDHGDIIDGDTPDVSSASSAEEDEEDWNHQQTPQVRKVGGVSNKRKSFNPAHKLMKMSSFIDMSFWKKERICCGVVFKGPHDELLIYPKLLKPCACRLRRTSTSSQHSHSQDSNGSVCITPSSEGALTPASPSSSTTDSATFSGASPHHLIFQKIESTNETSVPSTPSSPTGELTMVFD